MATKFVHPQKEVLCYYGDGSFGMTAWDMETAQRFKLPYMAVIGNNSAMNQIRCGQIGKYGPERGCVGNKLGDVDFEKFAECFGGWGIAVREPSQIRPALEKAPRARCRRTVRHRQHLGRHQRIRAGTRGADDVQIRRRIELTVKGIKKRNGRYNPAPLRSRFFLLDFTVRRSAIDGQSAHGNSYFRP
jgi:hypothetical protein